LYSATVLESIVELSEDNWQDNCETSENIDLEVAISLSNDIGESDIAVINEMSAPVSLIDGDDDIIWETDNDCTAGSIPAASITAESAADVTIVPLLLDASPQLQPTSISASPIATATVAASTLANDGGSGNGDDGDEDMYSRAVLTASKMGDWAGRAVLRELRFLKKTVPTPQQPSVQPASETETATVTPVTATSTAATAATAAVESEVLFADLDEKSPDSPEQTLAAARQFLASAAGEGEELRAARALSTAARDAAAATEDMISDVIELLRAFELPFIVAPFEAEAQCAVLEEVRHKASTHSLTSPHSSFYSSFLHSLIHSLTH